MHKYKKSLGLQDTTIQLGKKGGGEYYQKGNGVSTERFSKEKGHKRSVDGRIKTDMD